MRHLTHDQALAALRRGKAVEQLLASDPHDGRATVRWIAVFPGDDGFVVRSHHVYDAGGPDFLDVSVFEPVDGDEYSGEGVEVAREPEPEAALRAALNHGGVAERWVNQGVIDDEYADSRGWT